MHYLHIYWLTFDKFTNIWLCVFACWHTPDTCTGKMMARLNNDPPLKKSESDDGNEKLKQIFSNVWKWNITLGCKAKHWERTFLEIDAQTVNEAKK